MRGGCNVKIIYQPAAAPASPAVIATSAVWEVIERRKREKADLEEVVIRKEEGMAGGVVQQAEEVIQWSWCL